ncbi:hypothetical protein MRB53_037391 [Persea americana]|nr:hypothetical protein MRB53_037391 [Persea americana]
MGDRAFSGSVQVAKNPNGTVTLPIFDECAGAYALRGAVSASVSNASASYSLSWTKGGNLSRTLLMFALPHHVQSFSPLTSSALITNLQLETTTKGLATAVVADSWELDEQLPVSMGFAPWSPSTGPQNNLPPAAQQLISTVAASELSQDFTSQTDLDSMYFSGKGLAKFAFTVYAANDLANNTGVASAGLLKLKNAFSRFVNNTQIYPLVYDSVWGGRSELWHILDEQHRPRLWQHLVQRPPVPLRLLRLHCSSHRLPRLDLAQVRHEQAVGEHARLFESGDGKDQESSSEDSFASYAIKMWGHAIGDPNMEARGNLMLAIQARSFQNYFLMESNNTVQPPNFVGNKVSGIVSHPPLSICTRSTSKASTCCPLNPSSTLTRRKSFVAEEWAQYFAANGSDPATNVSGGWRGILYANLAIIDAKTSYDFFASSNFSNEWLDGGASRTWYLSWAAGLGGAS